MSQFKKQISIDRIIPAELSIFLNQQQYEIILDYALDYLTKEGKLKYVKEGIIFLESPRNANEQIECQLFNLARRIKDAPESTWKSAVESHFKRLKVDWSKAKYTFKDLDYAYNKIKIIIRPEAAANEVQGLVFRKHIPTTATYLVLDDDKALRYIRQEEIHEWERTEDELFEIAFENIAKEKIDIMQLPMPGLSFFTLSNENYSTSFLLKLEKHAPKSVGNYGAVFAIPVKAMAMVCPINNTSPMAFIHTMDKFVQQTYHQNDVPISSKYFWYYEGKFEIFPEKHENGKKLIAVPVNLKKLLAQYQN